MKKSGLNLVFKILLHITFIVYMVCQVGGPILLNNSDIINSVLGIETNTSTGGGGGMYYDTSFENMAQVNKASKEIIEETMSEGAVLLKNENNALPLNKGDSVTMYGMASYYTVITGQGSSGIESGALDDRVSLYEGLSAAGLNVNAELNAWYGGQNVGTYMGGGNFTGGSTQTSRFVVKDIAWSALPEEKSNSAKAAIMVFARNSGEASDMYMDVTMDDGKTHVSLDGKNGTANDNPGDSLSLTENEKSVLQGLKELKKNKTIDSIIVLMNSASPLQCEFLNDEAYDIDACMWVGTIGTTGATAIGKLLVNDYNPSGKTTDTFWANSKYNPVYYNFGSMEYGNSSALQSYFATNGFYNNKYYVAYQEGIYNGYKYSETRYEDVVLGRANVGEYVYEDVVSYPFGYGLSYSSFTYSNMKVEENTEEATYTVTVDVTNTSALAGKEAVQIYLQKPYTAKDIQNGVEKASVELVGFTKVAVPARETVTATVSVDEKYFAAYDSDVEKTYVIGSEDPNDKYLLTAAQDAHDAVNNILKYKSKNSVEIDSSKMYSNAQRGEGDADLVWGKYIAYDNTKYSTNEFIQEENANFTPDYEGQKANYGVSKITNQFEDTDFKKVDLFTADEKAQAYMTRNDWTGTYGKRINLTATNALKTAQENPAVETDNIPYPKYNEMGFYESATEFDEIKLIYLRGKDYNDPLWDTLLDRMTWEETCTLLQTGLRLTNGVESIAAPSTSQQNGAIAPVHARTYGELPSQSGFRGFSEVKDPENKSVKPAVFVCNGIVAATYNTELIERLGVQTGEESIWAGYNGIYGLGVNIHRGAYCGRTYEYYSEDGFLTGVAAGYEAVGMHKLGVFVLMKHAVLNDQETRRAGINVWANEQTIREIYSRALEVAIKIEAEYIDAPMLGVMTGMNRLGAKWTGGQGFCNTVLRAEYGMKGYVVSDYNSSRVYMSPIQGVLYGNDLPDGNPAGGKGGKDYDGNDIRFASYETGYGELAWAMRTAAKNILYTVVNSNAMNGITGNTVIINVTPWWQIAVPVVTRVAQVAFIWAAALYGVTWIFGFIHSLKKDPKENS